MSVSEKQLVRDYWEERPCGSGAARADWGTREFFDQIEAHRYRAEPFIPHFADFQRWAGKRVLEIGTGSATDFVNFARRGAIVTGVDLTTASVELARQRLGMEGLSGDVRVADAEQLPFADRSFDLVYSWGVLHHTPDTSASIREVWRVLDDGGEARIMLYARYSWTGFRIWIKQALLKGRPLRSLTNVFASHVESPGTKAYSLREIRDLFSDFEDVTFHRFRTPYDERGFGPIARMSGNRLGGFIGITASRGG
jgi:ubiquinone/menaquinone biosynthesis C-methylase UbiE